MKFQAIYALLTMAYATVLRPLLAEAVNDPEKEWDEWMMQLLDNLFNYKGGQSG